MKAAFKWRLQNGIYGYLTDETGVGDPFAYDVARQTRIYSDGTIIVGSAVNESAISTAVSKMSKQDYTDAFNKFKQLIDAKYPQVTLLDVIYYYNMENDECTDSASSLKCSATDIMFDATAVTGDTLSVTVTNEQTDPNTGEMLRYKLDFVFPIEGGGGSVVYTSVTSDTIVVTSLTADEITVNEFNSTNISSENLTSQTIVSTSITSNSATINVLNTTGITANTLNTTGITANTLMVQEITVSSITVSSSITANSFVKSGGTGDEYLMADGSVTILSAGTNVHITTGGTEDRKIITISSDDTNTWRKVQVDGSDILGNGVNTNALNLSAGTNITLTNDNGTVTISSTNSSTDTKVYQQVNNSDTSYRPLILGYSSSSSNPPSFTDQTDQVYASSKVFIKPSSGDLYVNDITIGGIRGIKVTDMMPIGSVIMWPSNTAPTGWLICDGKTICPSNNVGPSVDYRGLTYEPLCRVIDDKYALLKSVMSGPEWSGLYIKNGSFNSTYSVFTISDWTSNIDEAYKFYTIPTSYKYERTTIPSQSIQKTYVYNLPDLRQRFPLGKTDSSLYVLIENTWNNIVPSGIKSMMKINIGSTPSVVVYNINLTDLVDDNGYKKTSRPSGLPSVFTDDEWAKRRDEIYNNYLNKNYNDGLIIGEKGGELEHVLTEGELATHNHSVNYIGTDGGVIKGKDKSGNTVTEWSKTAVTIFEAEQYNGSSGAYIERVDKGMNRGNIVNTESFISDTGSNYPHNNTPPYYTLNFIIKYK